MDSRKAQQLFQRYAPCMAYIAVMDAEGKESIGSAFHVGEGVFVTARHVVENVTINEVRTTQAFRWTARSGKWPPDTRLSGCIPSANAFYLEVESLRSTKDLEQHVVRSADISAQTFNPHACRDSASRLIRYYTRLNRNNDVKRLHAVTAKAFEHLATTSSAMLAAALLQDAMDEYRDAGLPEESRRVRILMQQKIGESRSEMASISHEVQIKKDDIERFLEASDRCPEAAGHRQRQLTIELQCFYRPARQGHVRRPAEADISGPQGKSEDQPHAKQICPGRGCHTAG
jgi:hypothetical protein